MNLLSSDCVLVVLNVTPGLEEPVVDWLLGREGDAGFTSGIAYGHGADNDGLSIAEQVTGRRRRVRFEVAMPAAARDAFLAEAATQFGSADVHVMVLPMLANGPLAAVSGSKAG